MVWKGSEAARNQCEQSSEEAWKIKENPYTKGRKDKAKIKTHTHTHTHFRVTVGKAENHAENEGWPEGLLACNWMKIKNELRPARRTCS